MPFRFFKIHNNRFWINLESVSFVRGKLKHRNFGITLYNLQLFRNRISNSTLAIFMDIFSSFCSWDASTISYLCTVSCIILPNFCVRINKLSDISMTQRFLNVYSLCNKPKNLKFGTSFILFHYDIFSRNNRHIFTLWTKILNLMLIDI